RHDADREDRQLQERTTREQVDQRVQLRVVSGHRRVEQPAELGVVDAGRRDLCADPVQDDDPEGEEYLLPQVTVLDRGRECGEHMSSWSWTARGRLSSRSDAAGPTTVDGRGPG